MAEKRDNPDSLPDGVPLEEKDLICSKSNVKDYYPEAEKATPDFVYKGQK